jgi:hypothetical protein
MVGANALLTLPRQDKPFAAGESVMAIMLDHPESEPYPASDAHAYC